MKDRDSRKMINEPVLIYGLIDTAGKIAYIGQTRDRVAREASHARTKPAHIFRILRSTTDTDASRLETQMIAACQRNGAAYLNKRKRGVAASLECSANTKLIWVETGERFRSLSLAYRRFPYCSKTALVVMANKSNGQPFKLADGVTLQVAASPNRSENARKAVAARWYKHSKVMAARAMSQQSQKTKNKEKM